MKCWFDIDLLYGLTFTKLKIQNRLYLKMAKTELACLCMEPFDHYNLIVF